jgi:Fructose-bisphosphate aldolase class-I
VDVPPVGRGQRRGVGGRRAQQPGGVGVAPHGRALGGRLARPGPDDPAPVFVRPGLGVEVTFLGWEGGRLRHAAYSGQSRPPGPDADPDLGLAGTWQTGRLSDQLLGFVGACHGPEPRQGSGRRRRAIITHGSCSTPEEGSPMTTDTLTATAQALVAPGKGILAADESTGTIKKRFQSI